MNPHYAQVALRAGHRCEYCRAPEVVFNFPFEVEHIVPIAQAGADIESNWALACRSCNLWKAAHLEGFDPESGIEVRLFHPTDYAYCEAGPNYLLEPCACGSSLCRGRLTGNDWKLPELRRRYRGYFTPHIERLIQAMYANENP